MNAGAMGGAGDRFWALRDVSFAAAPGEALGIIGPNGAGKSTALKLLAGILAPDEGTIHVAGRLAALIEVGAGFHGDLTGRENIYLNGAILGMKRREIHAKLDAIVAFAGLEQFLDTPVKRYSSGMYARLGFSIAAHVDPDVLLVDEVLSVGDAVFRQRCTDRMRALIDAGTTLIFVTHNLDQMQAICRRALVLDHGAPTFLGPPLDAVDHYMGAMSRAYAPHPLDGCGDASARRSPVHVASLRFLSPDGEAVTWTRPDAQLCATLTLKVERRVAKAVIELNMRRAAHENLLSLNSGRDAVTFDLTTGTHTIQLELPALPVSGGPYLWNVRVWDADGGAAVLDTPFRYPLNIDDGGRTNGVLCIRHQWVQQRGSGVSVLQSGESPEASAAAPAAPARDRPRDVAAAAEARA
ncbi:MAG: ABC transporter ATP-binding protein [Phycisphaerales bacterium]|nr:MAG: ABC transporter ATP-binding protein [Phycisphaerales bacterium]